MVVAGVPQYSHRAPGEIADGTRLFYFISLFIAFNSKTSEAIFKKTPKPQNDKLNEE